MARTSATISVGADTRQLEKDIQSALSRDFRFKGLNEKNFTQPLGRITGAANEFQKSLDASNARVIAFGASAGLIYTVQKAFTDLIRTTVDVQKSLTDINVILNTTTQGLAKFGGEVFNIAKDTGQSFQLVAQAATELARQGLGAEETLKRTRDALILTRLSGLDTVSAVEALTATINSFSKAALDSTSIINKLANVDASFAVSSADLSEAIKRVGSSAQDVNVNFDELLAIVTSVQQTTARGGAVIGNSLKTIFTRIQRTDVLDQLQALGVNVRDLEGNTLPAIQILKELGTTFDRLGDSQKAQVAESVGGVFQINILKAALGDLGKEYSVYERALKTSTSSTDEAIRRNQALNETIAALFSRTITNTSQLGATIGAGAFEPAIQNVLKSINKVLEFINNQDSEGIGGKLGEGILKGLSTFISGPGIVLITAVVGKLALNLSKFAASGFKDLLGINQQTQTRAQLQTKINQVLSQEPQLLAAINAKQVTVLSVENQILRILKEQNTLRTQAAALSSTISTSLVARGVGVKGGQITTKSSGFIPNYALSEIYGALAGGYKPGRLKEMNISGEGRVIYNSAEKVKKFAGMTQSAILPPKNSKAGKQYQKDFINQNGFNPYASDGFIPNFNAISEIRSQVPMSSVREQYKLRTYLRQGYEVLGGQLEKIASQEQNKYLINDGTLVRQSGQILIKSSKKDLILRQLRQQEISGARAAGQESGKAGMRSKYVYVYPDSSGEGGGLFLTGGKSEKTGMSYRFKAFPFPGAGEKIPDELYNDISNSLVQNAKKFIAGVSTRPQLVDQKIFEQYVKSNLSRSAVEAATGQVFEASVKAAIKRVSVSEIANFDLDKGELLAISKRFKSSKALKDFDAGDFKNSLSKSNLNSFADKIATKEGAKSIQKSKSKAKGFIPNFSAIGESIQRELSAGVPFSKIRVGQDNRLMSRYNPLGVGIYNTEDEPNGIKQGIAAQKNINVAKKAGSFSEGFIPNFAGQGPYMSLNPAAMTNLTSVLGPADAQTYARDEIQKAKAEFNKIVNELRNQQRSLKSATKEVDDLKLKYNLSNQSVSNMNRSLQGVAARTKSFNQNISDLERSAGGIFGFGGGRSIRELERIRDTTSGERAQRASSALDRAQQRRQAGLARLQGAGIGLSIGIPMVAQTAAEFFPQNRKAQGIAEGIGTAASFAGIGALFGPPGIAIGALVGSAIGLKKAFDTINDQTEKYAKKAQESANSLSRFNENVQKFLSLRDQVKGMQAGEIKATKKDLSIAEQESKRSLGKIFQDSGPEITRQIIQALESGDESLLREALGRAEAAKQAASNIDSFTSSIVKLKKESGGKILKEDIGKNIENFINLRTRSGKSIGEYIIEENLLKPLQNFEFLSQKGFRGATTISPEAEKELERLKSLSRGAQPIATPYGPVNPAIPLPQGFRDITELQAFAGLPKKQQLKYIESGSAQKALDAFGKSFDQFSQKLVNAGEITQDQSTELSTAFSSILAGNADPTEKIKNLTSRMREFGGSLELAAQAINNIAKGIFSFEKLSRNLNELFAQGDGTEEGDAKAKQRRLAGAEILKQANFSELFQDPEFKQQYGPSSTVGNLIKSTAAKIAEGTQEDEKRISLINEFSDEFKTELESLAKGGKLTDEQLAKLRAGLDRAAQKASISSDNLGILNSTISDASLRQEAINKYKAIEAQLTQELNGNINLLIPALSNAAKSISVIQQARSGEIFLEEKNAQLIKDSIDSIKSKNFKGLDIKELTTKSTEDLKKEIVDFTMQGISSINESSLDEQSKNLARERLKNLEQEQLNLIKSQGSLSARQVSEFQSKLKVLNASNSSLKNGFDTLNTSILDSTLRQDAANKFEIIRAELEKKYGDNLVKLDLATQAAAENLSLLAQSAEGSIFSDELLSGRQANREKNIKLGNMQPMDFADAFTDTFDYNTSTLFRDIQTGTIETARTMKSEFNNAFLSFARGTETAGDAFRKMALNISDKIQQLALELTTNVIFGKLLGSTGGGGAFTSFLSSLGKSKGGIIRGYSSGGNVVGGSGTKDDVPAMLSAGEYVIRKSAVNKYGAGLLGMINGGMIPKFGAGGFLGVGGPSHVLQIAGQALVSNAAKIAGQGASQSEGVGLGISNSFMGLMQKNKNKNNFFKYGGRVQKFATGGELQFLGQNVYRYNDPLFPTGGENVIDPRLSLRAILDPSNPQNKIREEREQVLYDYLNYVADVNESNRQGLEENIRINQEIQNQYKNQKRQGAIGAYMGFGMSLLGGGLSLKNGGHINRFASGGQNEDNVPALLMDGEFVMRKQAVNLYGKRFFDDLNSGRVKKFADGGVVGNTSQNETVTSSNPTNNINITINMERGVQVQKNDINVSSSITDLTSQKSKAEAMLFASKIRDQVLVVINEQQRPGGMLSSSVYKKIG